MVQAFNTNVDAQVIARYTSSELESQMLHFSALGITRSPLYLIIFDADDSGSTLTSSFDFDYDAMTFARCAASRRPYTYDWYGAPCSQEVHQVQGTQTRHSNTGLGVSNAGLRTSTGGRAEPRCRRTLQTRGFTTGARRLRSLTRQCQSQRRGSLGAVRHQGTSI